LELQRATTERPNSAELEIKLQSCRPPQELDLSAQGAHDLPSPRTQAQR
jgi:hypothetical protein